MRDNPGWGVTSKWDGGAPERLSRQAAVLGLAWPMNEADRRESGKPSPSLHAVDHSPSWHSGTVTEGRLVPWATFVRLLRGCRECADFSLLRLAPRVTIVRFMGAGCVKYPVSLARPPVCSRRATKSKPGFGISPMKHNTAGRSLGRCCATT